MYIDKKILAIVTLSLSAIALGWAVLFSGPVARANTVLKDRDYQMVTARLASGGEGVYILDNRNGLLLVFTYDPNVRGARPRQCVAVSDLFTAR